MPYNSNLERAELFFSQSRQSLYPHERVGYRDQDNFEVDPFAAGATMGTLHHSQGCMHCRVYSRHVEESTAPFDTSMKSTLFSEGVPSLTYQDGIRFGRFLQEEEDRLLLSRYREELDRFHERYENSLLKQSRYRHELEGMKGEVAALNDQLLAIQIAYDDVTMFSSTVGSSATHQRGTTHTSGCERAEAETREYPELDYHEQDEDYFEIVQQVHLEEEPVSRYDIGSCSDLDGHSDTSATESHDSSLGCISSISSSSVHDKQSPSAEARPNCDAEAVDEELSVEEISSLMKAAHTHACTEALDQVRLLINDAEQTPKPKRTAAQRYILLKWRKPKFPSPSPPPVSVPTTLATTSLLNPPPPTHDPQFPLPEIFVDASGFGIGFILKNRWLAWSFNQGHPDIPIGPDDNIVMSWAELIAAEMGIHTLVTAGYRNTKVTLRSDNDGVIAAFTKRTWTKNYGLDKILERVLKVCQDAGLVVIPRWISTKVNPADKPSRGTYPSWDLLYGHHVEIPEYLQGILNSSGLRRT